VPRNVFMLGVVSCFADISGEMIYLIPIFLTSVLGAPVAVVGLIEGSRKAPQASSKSSPGGGRIAPGSANPRYRRLRTRGSWEAAPAVAFVWPVVLLGRFVDRFGKGMRGSPRDALIADSAPENERGGHSGFIGQWTRSARSSARSWPPARRTPE
jgi:hypothetical protein